MSAQFPQGPHSACSAYSAVSFAFPCWPSPVHRKNARTSFNFLPAATASTVGQSQSKAVSQASASPNCKRLRSGALMPAATESVPACAGHAASEVHTNDPKNLGMSHNVASQFDPAGRPVGFRFHKAAAQYAPFLARGKPALLWSRRAGAS